MYNVYSRVANACSSCCSSVSSALSRAYHTAVSFGLTPESSHYVLGITHTALVGLLRGKSSMSLCAFFKKYNEHVAIVVHMRYRITRVSDKAIPVSEFYRLNWYCSALVEVTPCQSLTYLVGEWVRVWKGLGQTFKLKTLKESLQFCFAETCVHVWCCPSSKCASKGVAQNFSLHMCSLLAC